MKMMEIFNIGIDIVNIERFKKKSMLKIKNFIRRFLLIQKSNIAWNLKTAQNILLENLRLKKQLENQ